MLASAASVSPKGRTDGGSLDVKERDFVGRSIEGYPEFRLHQKASRCGGNCCTGQTDEKIEKFSGLWGSSVPARPKIKARQSLALGQKDS